MSLPRSVAIREVASATTPLIYKSIRADSWVIAKYWGNKIVNRVYRFILNVSILFVFFFSFSTRRGVRCRISKHNRRKFPHLVGNYSGTRSILFWLRPYRLVPRNDNKKILTYIKANILNLLPRIWTRTCKDISVKMILELLYDAPPRVTSFLIVQLGKRITDKQGI